MIRRILGLALVASCMTACSVAEGPSHITLPGDVGTGSSGYEVDAIFRNVDNLVPNSQVIYNDLVVGTVRSMSVKNWQAVAHLSIENSLHLPANITAVIGQKSLLGAEYVELDQPSTPSGKLASGSVIGVENTGSYPATEQVLSAVSLLLNNGGLSQINTITSQLDLALGGNEDQTRDLISKLQTFVGSLDDQRDAINDALTQLNQLGGVLAKQQSTISEALDQIPQGLAALNQERDELTTAINKIGEFGSVASGVIAQSRKGLDDTLASLKPVLTALQQTGTSLPQSLEELTFPLPLQHVNRIDQGDFLNFYITVDVSAPSLIKDLVGPADLQKVNPVSLQAGNPLTDPLGLTSNAAKAAVTPAATSSGTSTTSPTPSPTPTSTPSRSCGLLASLLGGC